MSIETVFDSPKAIYGRDVEPIAQDLKSDLHKGLTSQEAAQRLETYGLNKLVEMCEGVKGGKLFYRITNFKMPTMAALGVEFMMMPKLFSLISKIDKAAVLTDEGWIAKASIIEGALIPGLEIEAFGLEQEEAAMAFLRS